MKKLLSAAALAATLTTPALADGSPGVKIGVFLGFTGPVESVVANIVPGSEMRHC